MTTPLLQIEGLQVAYTGAGLGVQGLDLDVHQGEVVALLGANGAGKSTTLRAISGYLPGDIARVTAGSITFGGVPLGSLSPHKRVRLGMSIVPEREKIFRTLTIEENLRSARAPPRGTTPRPRWTSSTRCSRRSYSGSRSLRAT